MATVNVTAVIKGYHVYKKRPDVGAELRCEPDLNNTADEYAMGVLDENSDLVGHVPAQPVSLQKALYELWRSEKTINIAWYMYYNLLDI